MPVSLSKIGKPLTSENIRFLEIFSRACRRSILEMTTAAQSGHPGGSLSCIDYLSLLYTQIISQTGEPVVISNGHISPAVYAVLAELGILSKREIIKNFRQAGSIFEGHVSRQVRGVWYSTGPLGTGASAATGLALAEQLQKKNKKVFVTIGDGESQEGQIYEMMNFAAKYKLSNLIAFLDYNEVQLSDGLKKIMPLDPVKIFTAGGWEVIIVNGHDYEALWYALCKAYKVKNKPILLVGHTVMGKGVAFMEQTGKQKKADWHGKAASKEQTQKALSELFLTKEDIKMLEKFQRQVKWKPAKPEFPQPLTKLKVKTGKPITYKVGDVLDCRTAYGKALVDLAKHNKNIIALTADLSVSVKTDFLKAKYPNRHIECGVAEQHMVSCAGGLSLAGFTPFASTFGAFMTSRAKDQVRVNDINETNVKMVATHCGLSVGEDGPTHQAIDDMGSMLGLLNTMVIEPADPNQTDHMIRYVASHAGNFYVRMGRHKVPILTKENGTPFFDATYTYTYGQSDIIRKGKDLTLCASGSMVTEAYKAWHELKKMQPKLSIELVVVSSPKQFDETLINSILKTKKVLTVEDHNTRSGFGSQLARHLALKNIKVEKFAMMGVDAYQTSGSAEALYERAGISNKHIKQKILSLLKKGPSSRIFFFF